MPLILNSHSVTPDQYETLDHVMSRCAVHPVSLCFSATNLLVIILLYYVHIILGY